jgi:hypothetical protein
VSLPVVNNKAEVCETIKTLANEVIESFQKTVMDQREIQHGLQERSKLLCKEYEDEESNGRRLQKAIEDTEIEQARLGEAEDFESADLLTIKAIPTIKNDWN